jgi:hypothetical protein
MRNDAVDKVCQWKCRVGGSYWCQCSGAIIIRGSSKAISDRTRHCRKKDPFVTRIMWTIGRRLRVKVGVLCLVLCRSEPEAVFERAARDAYSSFVPPRFRVRFRAVQILKNSLLFQFTYPPRPRFKNCAQRVPSNGHITVIPLPVVNGSEQSRSQA